MSTVKKYLDAEGVGTLWNKIKQNFSKTDSDTYCDSDSAATAKVATHSGYVLRTGNCSMITFTKNNTATGSLTLNVNNTGAKPLTVPTNGNKVVNPGAFNAGTYYLYYNGTSYVLMRTFDDVRLVLFPNQVGTAGAPIYINSDGNPTVASVFTSGSEDQLMASTGSGGVKWINSAPKATVAAKVNHALSLQLNGGSATTFDGSTAETVDITASAIGAAVDSAVVKLTGAQTIAGAKTFTGAINNNGNKITSKSSSGRTQFIQCLTDITTTAATSWVAIASINIADASCRGLYSIEFAGSGNNSGTYNYDRGHIIVKLRDQAVYTSVTAAAKDSTAVFDEYSGALSFGIKMSGTTATLYAKINSNNYCFSIFSITVNAGTPQNITVPRLVILTSDPSMTALSNRMTTTSDSNLVLKTSSTAPASGTADNVITFVKN